MEKEYKPVTNAINIATGGTFKVPGSITLMGWAPKYDSQGRPLNADPNINTGEIVIEDETYIVRTAGWNTKIILARTGELYEEIDRTPDYVKEYYDRKKGK